MSHYLQNLKCLFCFFFFQVRLILKGKYCHIQVKLKNTVSQTVRSIDVEFAKTRQMLVVSVKHVKLFVTM